MAKGYYICACGREFNDPQKFNGHKSHCITHLSAVHKLECRKASQKEAYTKSRNTYYAHASLRKKLKVESQEQIKALWISEHHTCEHCGKVMMEKFGSGRFCCRSCANSHTQTDEINQKRRDTLKNRFSRSNSSPSHVMAVAAYNEHPKTCLVCGATLPKEIMKNVVCSPECRHIRHQESGKKAAEMNTKRSKHEVAFYNLCKDAFTNVTHNEALFNGWDADIILHDFKLAILWNGPWHYREVIKNQRSSLAQIKNRDAIKLKEIAAAGYVPYVVKDLTDTRDMSIVEEEFKKLLAYIAQNYPQP